MVLTKRTEHKIFFFMQFFRHILNLLCRKPEILMSKGGGKKKEDSFYRTWPSEDRNGKLKCITKAHILLADRKIYLHVSLTKEKRIQANVLSITREHDSKTLNILMQDSETMQQIRKYLRYLKFT